MKHLAPILTVILLTCPAMAATYYAAPSNIGSGDGSSAANAKALGSTASWVSAGDTIVLVDGSYGGLNVSVAGSSGSEITFQAQHQGEATFSNVTLDQAYNILDGVEVIPATGFSHGIVQSASHTTVKNCIVHGQLTEANLINHEGYGIQATTTDTLTEDCEVYECFMGIETNSTNIVRRCDVHDIISSALRSSGAATFEDCRAYNCVESRSVVADPHASGCAIKGSGVTFRRCLIYNYGSTSMMMCYGSQGFATDGYQDITIEDCVFAFSWQTYDLGESGVTQPYVVFTDMGPRCVIRNNTFGAMATFFLCASNAGEDCVIANNLFLSGLQICGPWTTGYQDRTYAQQMEYISAAVTNGWVENSNIYYALWMLCNGYRVSISPTDAWVASDSVTNSNASYWAEGTMFQLKSGYGLYQLKSDAPAVGSADDTYATSTDFWGNSRDVSPDIGAIEYGAGTSVSAAATPSPANSATGVSLTAGLSWGAVSGASCYNVYFGTDSTPDSDEYQSDTWAGLVPYTTNSVPVTDLVASELTASTTYYWQINPVSATGVVTVGTVWSFITGDGDPPAETTYILLRKN